MAGFNPEEYKELKIKELVHIPGFFVVDLVINGDSRGWFKENYQQAKLEELGLPHFVAVQNNFSYNEETGVTRGMHAEPWEKFISLACGSVFGAWVDLRRGPNYGQTFSMELNPGQAVFVPRGVANSYQTLEPKVTYTYLVNEHWSPEVRYVAVDMFDPELGIAWPISADRAIVSEKDKNNPAFSELTPIKL